MSHQRVVFRRDGNNMMLEQRGQDGYHVPITTTEWMPNTMETPRYPDFGYFFNDNNSGVHEGYHGDGYDKYASPRHTENVLVKKHHVHYEPVTEESVFVQRHQAQYEPAAENVFAQRPHAQYEPVTEKVTAKKHQARYEPVKEGKRQAHREDVNIEADDFIKRKHRALDQSKFMSMKTYN